MGDASTDAAGSWRPFLTLFAIGFAVPMALCFVIVPVGIVLSRGALLAALYPLFVLGQSADSAVPLLPPALAFAVSALAWMIISAAFAFRTQAWERPRMRRAAILVAASVWVASLLLIGIFAIPTLRLRIHM